MSFLGNLLGTGGGAFLGNLVGASFGMPGLGTLVGGFTGSKLSGSSDKGALLSSLFNYGGQQLLGSSAPEASTAGGGGTGEGFGWGLNPDGSPVAGSMTGSAVGSMFADPMMAYALPGSDGSAFATMGMTGSAPGASMLGEGSPWEKLFRFGSDASKWLGQNKGMLRTGLGLYGFGRMQAARSAMRPPSLADLQGSPEYAAALDAAQRSAIAGGGFGSGQMMGAAAAVGPQVMQQLYGRNMEMAGGRANADMASLLMLSSILGG